MKIIIFCCLFALAAPLLLLPIELLGSYAFVAEELVKAIIVYVCVAAGLKNQRLWLGVSVAALLFAVSEDVLYLANFSYLGNFDHVSLRILLTSFLHLGTSWMMLFGATKNMRWFIGTCILAVCCHLIFNQGIITLW